MFELRVYGLYLFIILSDVRGRINALSFHKRFPYMLEPQSVSDSALRRLLLILIEPKRKEFGD